MSLANPFARRGVQVRGVSVQITLPGDDLAEHDVEHEDVLPCWWNREAAELTIRLNPQDSVAGIDEDADWGQPVVVIGECLGVTIPAHVRDEHAVDERDSLLLEPIADGDGWRIDLEQSTRAAGRSPA